MNAFTTWIRRAKLLGFEGGFCIHPNQIRILNTEFVPSAREVEAAQLLVEVFDSQTVTGSGVISYKGRMVDKPVVDRARRTLKRHDRLVQITNHVDDTTE